VGGRERGEGDGVCWNGGGELYIVGTYELLVLLVTVNNASCSDLYSVLQDRYISSR